MPALRSNQSQAARLVVELAAKLRETGRLDQPYVLQDRIPQTRARHAVVIWDRWSAIPKAERSEVIHDAYERAGLLGEDTITVAMGITQREALDMGYFNFSIVPTRREGDPVGLRELRRAMQAVGGVHVTVGDARELRFATMEQAQEAYRRLTEKVPGPYWAIVEERVATGQA